MIPSMTNAAAHLALDALGQHWTGRGVAVECGCWLGASSAALLRGLVAADYDRPFYAFDRWEANDSEVRKAGAVGVRLAVGEDLMGHWLANVAPVYGKLQPCRCDLAGLTWKHGPVEVLVMDAAKREPTFSHVMGEFVPHLVDGAWVVLLDYDYWLRFDGPQADALRCQERWMEGRGRDFRMVTPIGVCGMVFRYRQEGVK